jgi:hypothetical protein
MKQLQSSALLLAFLILSTAPRGAGAQAAGGEFERITVGFGLLMQLNTTPIDEAWEPGAGVESHIETPFYLGRVQAGIQILPYSTIRPDMPDYRSRFFFLDWRLPLRLARRLRWSNGLRFGIVQMDFDDPSATWHDRVDHELGAGPVTALEYEILDGWILSVTAARRKVYLSDPIEQTLLHLSIGRSLATPRWLLEFLR